MIRVSCFTEAGVASSPMAGLAPSTTFCAVFSHRVEHHRIIHVSSNENDRLSTNSDNCPLYLYYHFA